MSLIDILRRAVSGLSQKMNQARAIRQLQAMSDRQLSDIGIVRAEIDAVVTGKIALPQPDPALVRPMPAANRSKAPEGLQTKAAA